MIKLPVWKKADGSIIACVEKIKVMQENYEELYQMLQSTLEDGLLMEIDEMQIRQSLHELIDTLKNPYSC